MESTGKSPFFERLEELMSRYNIGNVSRLAEALGYSAPEKLNRLKLPANKPSIDILVDIVNKWPEVDLNWLLTGHSQRDGAHAVVSGGAPENQTYLKEYIESIKDHNSFLQEMLKSNLIEISDRQLTLQAEVQAIHQWDAQTVAKGHKEKEEVALRHMQQLSAGNLKKLRKKSKHVEVDK